MSETGLEPYNGGIDLGLCFDKQKESVGGSRILLMLMVLAHGWFGRFIWMKLE